MNQRSLLSSLLPLFALLSLSLGSCTWLKDDDLKEKKKDDSSQDTSVDTADDTGVDTDTEVKAVCRTDQDQPDYDHGFMIDPKTARWQEFQLERSDLCRLEFILQKRGNPGDLLLSITTEVETLWEGTVPDSELRSGPITVDIAPPLVLDAGHQYRLEILGAGETATADSYYAWMGDRTSRYVAGTTDVYLSTPDFDYGFTVFTMQP